MADNDAGNVGMDESAPMSLITVTIKSTKDRKDIAIDNAKTIKELKEAAAKEFNATSEQLCLIFSGKILKDTDSVKDSNMKDGTTVHLVIKSANKTMEASEEAPPVQRTQQPQANIGASPFGLGGLGGLSGLSNLGFGSANFMDLQQRMQREMFSNPEMLHSMMDNPLVQQVVSNPDLLRQLITSNPQIRELIEGNPEIAQMMNNPELMRQMMDLARNPSVMQEMIPPQYRNLFETSGQSGWFFNNGSSTNTASAGDDQTSNSVATSTAGNNAASFQAFNNPGTESMMRQMIENPQQAMNIMQAPYVQSIMNFMAANPNVMQQLVQNIPGTGSTPEAQQQMNEALPYFSTQMMNPEVVSLMSNPRALQAILDIQQGMQQLQSEAPGFTGFGGPAPGGDATSTTDNQPGAAGGNVLSQMLSMMTPQDSNQTPETRYATQLHQLMMMGFINQEANIRALSATSGDLNAAVDRLLQQ